MYVQGIRFGKLHRLANVVGRKTPLTIEKQNDDYRISLEQGTPGLSHRWKVKHERRLSTRFISLRRYFAWLANSGGNHRTLKSVIPLKPEVDIDALSPDLAALPLSANRLAAMVSSRSRSAQAKRNRRSYVLACHWYCGRSGAGNANGPMGAWLVHHNVLPHMATCCMLKAIRGAH